MSRRDIENVAVYIAALAIVVGGILLLAWAASEVPCSWYRFAKASEVPARCLTNFKH